MNSVLVLLFHYRLVQLKKKGILWKFLKVIG